MSVFLIFISFVYAQIEINGISETIEKNNYAYVNDSKAYIEQYPHTLTKNTEAKITFLSRINKEEFDLCFDFPINSEYIEVVSIKKKRFFGLFNEDLKQVLKDKKRICVKKFNNDGTAELYYKLKYNGQGKIKYNVTLLPSEHNKDYSKAKNKNELIILDPYLIGDLNIDHQMILYFPFNNNTIDKGKEHEITVNEADVSEDASTSCNGATWQLVRTWSLSSASYITNYSIQLRDDIGVGTQSYKAEFVYDDGTASNTSSIDYTGAYVTYNFLNPSFEKKVSSIRSWSYDAGDSICTISSRNLYASWNVTYGNNASYYHSLLDTIYDFSLAQSSIDMVGSNDGADTNINYDDEGALFNGLTSLITVNDDDTLDFGTNEALTIMGWIKPEALQNDTYGMVLQKRSGKGYEIFYDDSGGGLFIQVNDGATKYPCSLTGVGYDDGNWHFFAFTRDSSGNWFCYADNNTIWQKTGLTGINGDLANTNDLLIGKHDTSNYWFNGSMDKIFIDNRSYSFNEIKKFYYKGTYLDNYINESNFSLVLDGNYDYVYVNDSLELEAGTIDFSICSWFLRLTNTNDDYIIDKRDTFADGTRLYISGSTDKIICSVDSKDITSDSSILDTSWNHVCCVIDRSGNGQIYLNGEVDGSAVAISNEVMDIDTKLHIGMKSYEFGANWAGYLDELMIFNKALTEEEVIELYEGYNNSINFTIRRADDYSIITDDTITVELYNAETGYTRSKTTSTGNVWFNGIPEGIIQIQSFGSLYEINLRHETLTTNNANYNFTIFMINETDSSLGRLFVYTYNQDYYAIKGADTRLLQFVSNLSDFIEVEQCFTDSNGECVFNIILANEKYKITSQATINGITSTATSSQTGNYYPIDNTEIELYLNFRDEYVAPDDYGLSVTPYNTTLNGNTSYLYAEFIDIYGNTHEVCLGYYYNDGLNAVLGSEECTNGSSGTVGYGTSYLLNRDYTWTAEIYTKLAGDKFKVYESYRYNKVQSFEEEYNDFLNPLIVFILAFLLGLAVELKNIIIFPIGMIPTTLVYAIMKPLVFTPSVSAIIIFFCVMLIYVGRKRSDNEST